MSDDLSGKGIPFHSLGPAAEKALSPYVFRDVLGMLKSLCEAERRVNQNWYDSVKVHQYKHEINRSDLCRLTGVF